MRLLETSGLTKRFGGLTVMNDLDFFIEEGEIKGFLGPNGAGKSTFFNLITGVHTPTSGHIIYGGKDITKAKPPSGGQDGHWAHLPAQSPVRRLHGV